MSLRGPSPPRRERIGGRIAEPRCPTPHAAIPTAARGLGHFESLPVDKLRQGWNAQKKQPFKPGEEGSSRTLCRCRPDISGRALALPFGWLLLRLEDKR